MPLTLEEEAKLDSLWEKALDLIETLIQKETPGPDADDEEFYKIIGQISAISPSISKMYLKMYNNSIPRMKSKFADWLKDLYHEK